MEQRTWSWPTLVLPLKSGPSCTVFVEHRLTLHRKYLTKPASIFHHERSSFLFRVDPDAAVFDTTADLFQHTISRSARSGSVSFLVDRWSLRSVIMLRLLHVQIQIAWLGSVAEPGFLPRRGSMNICWGRHPQLPSPYSTHSIIITRPSNMTSKPRVPNQNPLGLSLIHRNTHGTQYLLL